MRRVHVFAISLVRHRQFELARPVRWAFVIRPCVCQYRVPVWLQPAKEASAVVGLVQAVISGFNEDMIRRASSELASATRTSSSYPSCVRGEEGLVPYLRQRSTYRGKANSGLTTAGHRPSHTFQKPPAGPGGEI